jgi:hypothetical protein
MFLKPSELADALADPAAAELFSAVAGAPVLTVPVRDGADADALARLRGTEALPCVLVLLCPDPGPLRGHPAAGLGDLVLTDDPAAPRPFVTPDDGAEGGLVAVRAQADANPVAAAALAMLLRSSAGLPIAAGLVAESATYSTLQSGAEFDRWRAGRPGRAPEPPTGRVRVERTSTALRITLTRGHRRNALDAAMRDALAEAFALAVADREVAVEVRGEGPDFCAGGDLDEFGSRPDPALAHLVRLSRSPARLLSTVADRVTVHVHGACLGAGVELPSFAHHVVATPDATFGLPELSLGLVPGAGGTVSMPRRIGRSRTAWLGLSGRRIRTPEALRWGLVNEVTA